jgi:hypothetical protein
MTKLLIDERLSAELALMARERGHHQASHVVWVGKAGWKDWELKQLLLDEDWVLVTWNSKDFRGPREAPGSSGQFAGVSLHAGLVCINGPVGMDLWRCSVSFSRRFSGNWIAIATSQTRSSK